MSNKVIPIRKTPLKLGVLATARRTLLLRAGQLEITVEITAEARPLRTHSDTMPANGESKVLPIRPSTGMERRDESRD
jgi:hypothetical protein